MGNKLYEAFLSNSRLERAKYIVYFLLQFITLILIIVDLALNRWFQYCYWHFGLVYATSFTEYTELDNESAISDVRDDVCDDDKVQQEVENSCSNFCEFVDQFRAAGVVMIVFAVGSIMILIVNIVLHVWKINAEHKKLPDILVVICFFAQPGMFAIGLLLYATISGVNDLEEVDNPASGGNEYPRDFKTESGLKLGYAVGILSGFISIYAFFLTKKKLTSIG